MDTHYISKIDVYIFSYLFKKGKKARQTTVFFKKNKLEIKLEKNF